MTDQTNASELSALLARLTQLEVENAKLKAASRHSGLQLKISEKGGLSVIGLGQWPTTLYKSQWKRLLAIVPEIETFLADHDSVLADKAPAK